MTTAVIILSGGVDSTTLLHYVKDRYPDMEVIVLTYTYGQKHIKEVESAIYQAALFDLPHAVLDLGNITMRSVGEVSVYTHVFGGSALTDEETDVPDMQDVEGDPQPPTYVPNRNMVFLALAVQFAEQVGADRVFYGAQAHDYYGYWDCTPEFVDNMNIVLRLNRGEPITIEAPFIHKSKPQVIELGALLGVDFVHTWSCYKGGEFACGVCPTCAERLNGFNANGLVDPLKYAVGIQDIL